MVVGSDWSKGPCEVCGEEHWKSTMDAFTRVCFECRAEMGLNTVQEVLAIIEWFKGLEPDAIKELRVGTRNKRKDNPRYGVVRQPAAPKVDPEKVAAGIRAVTHYGVIPDDGLHMDTNFVFAKNGAFEVRHSDVADIILALSPSGTTIPGLTETLTQGVRFNLPKVPFDLLAQTTAFFRGVMTRFNNAEAIVRIWWNTAERRYEIRVPDGGQQVSGAAVHHQDTFDIAGERNEQGGLRYVHVMDIHSHNNMSGFWSGTDDNDEKKAPEGRMFGVFGKVTQRIPDWKWRMRSREGFIELKVTDIFEVPDVTFDFPAKVTLKDLIVSLVSSVSLECMHDPFSDATCPEAWYATVNVPRQGTVQHQGKLGFMGRVGGHAAHDTKRPATTAYMYLMSQGKLEEFDVTHDTLVPTGITVDLTGAKDDDKTAK